MVTVTEAGGMFDARCEQCQTWVGTAYKTYRGAYNSGVRHAAETHGEGES